MTDMTFEEFCDYAKDNIAEHLPEYTMQREPSIKQVSKNNGVKCTGLLVSDKLTGNIAPNIYLEYYYARYQDGESIDQVLDMIADEFRTIRSELSSKVDMMNDETWQHDITRVFPKLVSLDRNRDMLADAVYMPYQDLAISFRVMVDLNKSGVSSTLLKQDKLADYGKSVDELYEIAMENYKRMFPPKIFKMDELLQSFIGIPGPSDGFEVNAYVISNDICVNGATTILDKDTLDQVREKIGGDFYLLPSSVHECIAVPVSLNDNAQMLEELVHEVNCDVLQPTDFLSDTVYKYDGEKRELTMCTTPEWMRERGEPVQEASEKNLNMDGPIKEAGRAI